MFSKHIFYPPYSPLYLQPASILLVCLSCSIQSLMPFPCHLSLFIVPFFSYNLLSLSVPWFSSPSTILLVPTWRKFPRHILNTSHTQQAEGLAEKGRTRQTPHTHTHRAFPVRACSPSSLSAIILQFLPPPAYTACCNLLRMPTCPHLAFTACLYRLAHLGRRHGSRHALAAVLGLHTHLFTQSSSTRLPPCSK